MADENKPTDKIDLASTELKIGGVNLKGSYIVWALAIAGSIAGSIIVIGSEWEKYQNLHKTVAAIKMPDGEPLVKLIEQVKVIDETLPAIHHKVGELDASAAKTQSDLKSLQTLMEANDVSKLQGSIATLKTSVDGVQVFTRDVQTLREKQVGLEKDMQVLKKDVDKQWDAIDSIGAGSLKGK
jgi:prefoldin subunit 5